MVTAVLIIQRHCLFEVRSTVHARSWNEETIPSSFTDFSGTGFQLAVESRVTSSKSVPDSFCRMPQMYWSISRPSRSADLLKPQQRTKAEVVCVTKSLKFLIVSSTPDQQAFSYRFVCRSVHALGEHTPGDPQLWTNETSALCVAANGSIKNITRAQLSLGLADRTHGAHSQPAPITFRV